jgi:hypothetical protein
MKRKKGKFPTFAVIVLVVGLTWLLNELRIFSFSIPWFPIVMIIASAIWIYETYKKQFPTFPVIVLLAGLAWLLSDLGILTIDIPWFPLIVVIIALGWIADTYRK